ncbi:uncharacterized protein LOC117177669 [Belonocnema kinseyi]|uniref:uncharacterized protein LOC117177669 n=1 Tax=Belonocnema kinseyi TaxID=2817044 RepID=UPI00143E0A7F|nr:uncharacterized protein LOC117177669 [Belonocnema kinseyi]
MIDCTPDVGHFEQDTTGKGATDFVTEKLKALDLDVDDIRGQCYDNGSNMRGQLKGVQSRILQIKPRAFFVSCNPRSLNLVVNDVAKANAETINVASKLLQDPHMNLPESVEILEDLSTFFTDKRTDEAFKEYLTEATHLATALKVITQNESVEYTGKSERRRKAAVLSIVKVEKSVIGTFLDRRDSPRNIDNSLRIIP